MSSPPSRKVWGALEEVAIIAQSWVSDMECDNAMKGWVDGCLPHMCQSGAHCVPLVLLRDLQLVLISIYMVRRENIDSTPDGHGLGPDMSVAGKTTFDIFWTKRAALRVEERKPGQHQSKATAN
ncbi:hypothetical protein TWF569_002193 [Orbilia oligospora]|nr:hypothetical protein TWF103_002136 [Orbilia oligospora]KAF3122357.1 hypothetical protein TWF569_002193 [Orbilia oligospora]